MRYLTSIVLVICMTLSLTAQEERITLINGKKYLLHVVEDGHTLYSIAKKYSVNIDYVIQENPGIDKRFVLGQEVKIPLYRQDKVEARKNPPKLMGEYLVHTVQRKETLFSLSQKYNVSIANIEAHNPDVRAGLKIGMQVKIPAAEIQGLNDNYVAPAIDQSKFYQHEVQPKETLYSLSKKYNVTVEDIKENNDGLVQGLKEGTTILIPKAVTNIDDSSITDIAPTNTLGEEESFYALNPALSKQDQYHVALMLPFDVENLEQLSELGNDQIALEFYLGAKIAIDSLRKLGLNVVVNVYDTKKDPVHVKGLLLKESLMKTHLFIGPMYKSSLKVVAPFAEKVGAHIVCPVPQNTKILLNRPYLSKAMSSSTTQIKQVGRYVGVKHDGANVVAVIPYENPEKTMLTLFKNTYAKTKENSWTKDSVVTYWAQDNKLENLEKKLSLAKMNVIYIPSDDMVFVSGVLNKLRGYTKEHNITVVGHETWLKFDQIDTEYKNDLKVTIPSATYVDYNNLNTKRFLKKYRSEYNTDPNKYGFLGFDVVYYYLKGLQEHGLLFLDEFPQVMASPTSTKFRFAPFIPGGGFENQASFILRYEDYELKAAN